MFNLFSCLQKKLFVLSIFFIPPALGAENEYFYLTDQRAENEISETSFLYINDHLVKTFHLDLNHNQIKEKIFLPPTSQNVRYSLCGEITISEHGHNQTYRVSNEGILYFPQNHHYEAVASEHFHNFFLIDYSDPESSQSFGENSISCPFSSS